MPGRELDGPSSFYAEGRYQALCAHCGRGGGFEVHHVVQRQRCRVVGAPQYAPDNALRLCVFDHMQHTNHRALLPLSCLRDENIAFAARWLGAGPGYEYLTRYYQGADARVDALLEVT